MTAHKYTARDFTGGGPARHREDTPGSRYWTSKDGGWSIVADDKARRRTGYTGPKGRITWSEFRIYLRGSPATLVAQTDLRKPGSKGLRTFADCVAFINAYEAEHAQPALAPEPVAPPTLEDAVKQFLAWHDRCVVDVLDMQKKSLVASGEWDEVIEGLRTHVPPHAHRNTPIPARRG